MGRFGQSSVSTRAAISVIALYALLMQGVLASTAQAGAFGPLGDITCAPGKTGPQSPDGGDRHSQALCCILACAASGAAYLATPFAASGFPVRTAATFVWTARAEQAAGRERLFHFEARGPPSQG